MIDISGAAKSNEAERSVGRVLAEFRDYDQMLAGIRARVNELQVNGERFDEFAGLPRGYLSKIAGSRPTRRIGMQSLGPLINALGIKCIFIEDPEATARLRNRLKPRNPNLVRSEAVAWHNTTSRRFLKKIGAKGGVASMASRTTRERKELARKAAQARWNKLRVTEIKGKKARAA